MSRGHAKSTRLATTLTDLGAIVSLGLAALAFYAGVCYPFSSMTAECQRRSEELERLLGSSQSVWEDQAALRKELAALKERAAAVRSRIPPHAEEAELLSAISRLAERSRFEIIDYRRGGVDEHATHQELRIGLRGEGMYPALCRFIHGLDELERLCAVECLEIKSEARAGRYPMDLSLVFHFGMCPEAFGSKAP